MSEKWRGGKEGVREVGKVNSFSNLLSIILLVQLLTNFILIQKLCSFWFWTKVAFFVQTACSF